MPDFFAAAMFRANCVYNFNAHSANATSKVNAMVEYIEVTGTQWSRVKKADVDDSPLLVAVVAFSLVLHCYMLVTTRGGGERASTVLVLVRLLIFPDNDRYWLL